MRSCRKSYKAMFKVADKKQKQTCASLRKPAKIYIQIA